MRLQNLLEIWVLLQLLDNASISLLELSRVDFMEALGIPCDGVDPLDGKVLSELAVDGFLEGLLVLDLLVLLDSPELVCQGYAHAEQLVQDELGDPVLGHEHELRVHFRDEARLEAAEEGLLLVEL